MLKKLRIKFVIINMTLVTAMLIVIFGMVMYFTKQNLEQESLRMMQEIALDPMQTEAPPEKASLGRGAPMESSQSIPAAEFSVRVLTRAGSFIPLPPIMVSSAMSSGVSK